MKKAEMAEYGEKSDLAMGSVPTEVRGDVLDGGLLKWYNPFV